MRKIPQILGRRLKKKGLHRKMCEFWGEDKKMIFIAKSTKKRFLLKNTGLMTSILGVSGLELLRTPVAPSLSLSLGHNSRLGGTFLF